MKLANEITLNVYRAVYQSCAPGDTNRRVVELIDKAYARCGVRGEASLNVGQYSAVPHGSSQVQTIREGDIVMVDDGCTCDGYTSDITRSWVYGKASDEQKKVFDIVHRAQSAALAAARPGVEAQSVDAAARKVSWRRGLGRGMTTSRIAWGMGSGSICTSGRTWWVGTRRSSRRAWCFRMSRGSISAGSLVCGWRMICTSRRMGRSCLRRRV